MDGQRQAGGTAGLVFRNVTRLHFWAESPACGGSTPYVVSTLLCSNAWGVFRLTPTKLLGPGLGNTQGSLSCPPWPAHV